mmetsp:Transcript_26859/g.61804  ORF Transcript_26859/g.61804 Transcript_26859/m.61804 type:complete len:213 (-) Transcript_26859:841-1479(-)
MDDMIMIQPVNMEKGKWFIMHQLIQSAGPVCSALIVGRRSKTPEGPHEAPVLPENNWGGSGSFSPVRKTSVEPKRPRATGSDPHPERPFVLVDCPLVPQVSDAPNPNNGRDNADSSALDPSNMGWPKAREGRSTAAAISSGDGDGCDGELLIKSMPCSGSNPRPSSASSLASSSFSDVFCSTMGSLSSVPAEISSDRSSAEVPPATAAARAA